MARAATPDIFADLKKIHRGTLTLSQAQINDLLAIEDPGFYAHKGIDSHTLGGGATTLTQAIVKKLYFKKFVKGPAKMKQTLIARYAVNSLVEKDTQIEVFIKIAYLGRCKGQQVYGFSDAADCYFNKNLAKLSQAQYRGLVAMLIAPNKFNPQSHPDAYAERLGRVKHILNGICKPQNHRDVYYQNCRFVSEH